jgi:hypothetical protein
VIRVADMNDVQPDTHVFHVSNLKHVWDMSKDTVGLHYSDYADMSQAAVVVIGAKFLCVTAVPRCSLGP